SITIAPTTPENANSSIHKGRSSVSNIIFNSLSTSLSKWFSPSDQNGNLRRKRETENDSESNDVTQEPEAASVEPPTKRLRDEHNQNDSETHPSSSRNLYLARHFSSSTPSTPIRRKMLVRKSSPFNFSEQMLTNSRRQSQIEPATITIDDNDDNSTDEEVNVNENVLVTGSMSNRKRLNIPPTARPASRISNPSTRTTTTTRNRFAINHTIDMTKDDVIEQDVLLSNGTPNESASESEDSSSRITLTQPNKFATIRPQSSAGRINTSLVHDDEPDQNPPRLSGLFSVAGKRMRGNNGLMNFSAHLQTNKSLFSDKNMPKSLNTSTTSLNSLNRRQSLNASLYGSTSALSDSRLTNTNSPFYSGRTMFGGASAYSRRAISSQRALRVPTQIRPSSSLSTLYSSTNSLANVEPNTSALSNTAKRISDLLNQFTTPLADVKKMASNSANHTPALVNHRKRFDDNDMLLNRSMRLSTPKTPYSRPSGVNSARKSPPTSELQVPTMSQLLQMKKNFQNNTEKVREVATASNSILNQTTEYKLPENNDSDSTSVRQSKIRNKITSTRASTKNVQDEFVQEVNLPNIALPAMKNMPDISLPFTKPKTASFDITSVSTTQATPLANSTVTRFVQNPTLKEENSTRTGTSQFSFASPTQLKLPHFDKNIDPINNFKFSEPINVEKTTNKSQSPTFGQMFANANSGLFNVKTSAVVTPSKDSDIPLAPLKKAGGVMEELNVLKTSIAPSIKTTTIQPQQSLSDLFKSKSSSKQWECPCCMINNDDTKTKCAACETPRNLPASKTIEQTVSAPITNSFGNQFKSNANTWECSSCMIRNKLEASTCAACETPKPGGLVKSVSSLPKLTVPSTDQGFKSIVAQQNARWECSACMTRNEANRKKCECCEQAKPGAVTDAAPTFSFGSASSSVVAPKFSFGVPFNEKVASSVVPISEAKAKIADVKPSFSFGAQTNSDAPAKTFSFGNQSIDKEKKADPPAATFSFGVKSTVTSNDNDLAAASKIASVPALAGFKFSTSPSQNKPTTVATPIVSKNQQLTEEKTKEPQSSESVFGSQNKNAVPLPVPVIPAIPVTNNSRSVKSDQKLPLFGAASKVESSALSVTDAKPTFGLTTTTMSTSSAQSSTLATTEAPALLSSVAPTFTFGQTPSNTKGGFSFIPTSINEQKAFPMPDFAQSTTKPPATTLTFGSSNVAITTTATAPSFGNAFFFGQNTTTASSVSTTTSPFGSTPSTTSIGFSFGSTSKPSQPISTTFDTQQPQATPAFPTVAAATTSSLPTEPATSPFAFRSTANIEQAPTFGQSSTPVFGQTNTAPITPFGCFGAQNTQTPTPVAPLTANVNPISNTTTNNAGASTFGAASPFGSAVNATQTPNFGSGNNGLNNSFGAPHSFGSPASGFSSMIHTAPSNSDEPSAKKHSSEFGALSNTNVQKPPAFSFGDTSSSNASKASFAFTTSASPCFNFSGNGQAPPSSHPYKFGSSTANTSGVFNFGSTETPSPITPFQFAGSSDTTSVVSGYTAASKNTRSSNTAVISKHIWIRNEDKNLNYKHKAHSAAISSSIPNNIQRKKQNHFAIKNDPAFDKFHRSKYKIVNVKSPVVAYNHQQHGSTNVSANDSTPASPVCTFDSNKTIYHRIDKSKFKYVNNNNLMDVPAGKQ
ncbi:Nuclear pore complex protein Nup153, partial [Pseudolycoriella hygida]